MEAMTELDAPWDVACDVGNCDGRAEWVLICVKCCDTASRGFLLCSSDARFMFEQPLIICVHCGRSYSPPTTAFELVELLNPEAPTA